MYVGGRISNCAALTQNTVYICSSVMMCCTITVYNPCFVVSLSMPTCVWSQESWSSNYWKAGSCCLLSISPPIVHKYFDNLPLQFCIGLSHVWGASVKLWITIESLWQSLRHNEGWYCHSDDDDMKDRRDWRGEKEEKEDDDDSQKDRGPRGRMIWRNRTARAYCLPWCHIFSSPLKSFCPW